MRKNISSTRITRRGIVGAGLSLIACPGYIRPSSAQLKRLVVVNSGGAMGNAKRKALYDPFTKLTGIEIVSAAGPDLAKMKVQVTRNDVEWDIVDINEAWLPSAIRQGLLEPIDENIVIQTGCIKQAKSTHAVGGTIAAGGIAFPTNRFSGNVPSDWAEFWDVKRFPGRRGLRNRISDTLEIALMADGVPPSQVYPCDIDRAFRSLDKIKPFVSHWIPQTEQTVSLITANETDYTFTYTSRAKAYSDSGLPLGYSMKQNILGIGWIGALKGGRNRTAAMQFLDFTMNKDRQIELANLSGSAPAYEDALAKVDPDTRKWMPEIGSADNLFVDAEWWDTNIDSLTLRFKEWLLT